MLMPPHNKGDVLNYVKTFLHSEQYAFSQLPDQPILCLPYRGKHGNWLCYVHVRQAITQIAFYSISPIKTPIPYLAKMAEFIARANYGLMIGCFELDFEDGEVRFKTSLDINEAPLSYGLLRPLLYVNLSTFDHYYRGIVRLIQEKSSPKEILQTLELADD